MDRDELKIMRAEKRKLEVKLEQLLKQSMKSMDKHTYTDVETKKRYGSFRKERFDTRTCR